MLPGEGKAVDSLRRELPCRLSFYRCTSGQVYGATLFLSLPLQGAMSLFDFLVLRSHPDIQGVRQKIVAESSWKISVVSSYQVIVNIPAQAVGHTSGAIIPLKSSMIQLTLRLLIPFMRISRRILPPASPELQFGTTLLRLDSPKGALLKALGTINVLLQPELWIFSSRFFTSGGRCREMRYT